MLDREDKEFLRQYLGSISCNAAIETRLVCIDGSPCEEAWAVYKVEVDKTTLLRVEDRTGAELTGVTIVDCTCLTP